MSETLFYPSLNKSLASSNEEKLLYDAVRLLQEGGGSGGGGGFVALQSLSVTENGTYTPDTGYTGFDEVEVEVEPDLTTLSATANGTYTPDDADGYSSVTVNVQPSLQAKSTAVNGEVTPDQGYDGLSKVTVAVPQPSGTKEISITQNGTTTEDVAAYATAQITVNVPTGGGSGVQGDTETMTDSQASFTATVTGTLTHFLIVASEAYANNTGTRMHLVYADSSGRLYGMRTNSGANAYSGTVTTVSVTFAANAITITVPANQAFAGGDYLWFAW